MSEIGEEIVLVLLNLGWFFFFFWEKWLGSIVGAEMTLLQSKYRPTPIGTLFDLHQINIGQSS